MLCEFARSFPDTLADLLDRDCHLRRNFREETATDLLMMGLVGLQSLGITVDFPDEVATGGDMEWLFAAPHDVGGGTYVRLIIQSKRSKFAPSNSGGYWFYEHLDHGDPAGAQAHTLVNYAATSPDGHATLPLYFFYHPRSAITPIPGRPNIEGLNVVLGDRVAKVVAGGCGRAQKKVEAWRDHFFSLSDLLCWPLSPTSLASGLPGQWTTEFLIDGAFSEGRVGQPAWHPQFVADRLNALLQDSAQEGGRRWRLEPATGLPDEIRQALAAEKLIKERPKVRRPRAIFTSSVSSADPSFEQNRKAMRARRHG